MSSTLIVCYQGEEVCMTKTMVSTSYQPVERCDLQPQTHCKLVTKPVPKLVVVPTCYTQEKEVCRRKQGLPRPAGKQTLIRWCKKMDGLEEPPSSYLPVLPKENIKPEFTVSDLLRTN